VLIEIVQYLSFDSTFIACPRGHMRARDLQRGENRQATKPFSTVNSLCLKHLSTSILVA